MANTDAAAQSAVNLTDLCERAKLTDDAKTLLKPEHTARHFLELLIARESFLDAIRLLAHLLPKREAVGWGCLCVRHVLGSNDASKISETHVAAERWVSSPDEENRRAAQVAADKQGLESPSSFLAMAAFFSDGSIAPANLQPVSPPEHATAQFVAGAIMLSAVKAQPEKASEKYRVFLQKGMALMARMQSGPKPV